MEITEAQYAQIEGCLPRQRGNVSLGNRKISMRSCMSPRRVQVARSAQALWQLAHHLHADEPMVQERRIGSRVCTVAARSDRSHQDRSGGAGSTAVKVHPDGTGALKKTARKPLASRAADGRPGFIWLPRMLSRHNVCPLTGPSARRARGPQAAAPLGSGAVAAASADGPRLRRQRNPPTGAGPGPDSSLPPHPLRVSPWQYNRAMYKRRNEIERPFRRLKGFRRIFSRFEKLDLMFIAFINFALIVDGLRIV